MFLSWALMILISDSQARKRIDIYKEGKQFSSFVRTINEQS